MNGLLALCYFCEQHGPRVLSFTHTLPPVSATVAAPTAQQQQQQQEQQQQHQQHQNPTLSSSAVPDSAAVTLKSVAASAPSDASLLRMQQPPPSQPTGGTGTSSPGLAARVKDCCSACSWDATVPGFLTHDEDVGTTFSTSFSPTRTDLYRVIRNACLRSLSCEVCPGREGPIFFGDEESGYTFSYAFFLPDAQARGMQRCYSIILVVSDYLHLISCWNFLVVNTHALVTDMQKRVREVAGKLGVQPSAAVSEHQPGRLTVRPDMFRRQRAGKAPLAALSQLTGLPDILARVHAHFSCMLKSCAARLFERQIEGPSTIGDCLDITPSLAGLEEMLEDGAIAATPEPPLRESGQQQQETEEPRPQSPASKSEHPQTPDLQQLQRRFMFRSLHQLQEALEVSHFRLLVFSTLVGNQVIVRGPAAVGASMLLVLSQLLPAACCTFRFDQSEYLDSYVCNFLGLKAGVVLPPHVTSNVIVVDVNEDPMEEGLPCPFFFILQTPSLGAAARGNTLFGHMKRLFAADVPESVLMASLASLREDWMQKVKVYFKISRQEKRDSDTIEKFLTCFGLLPEDLQVLRFWTRALSKANRVKLLLQPEHGV